jgi:AcrR family transcriptional regulator
MAEDKKQTVILEFEVDVDNSVTSINKLTAANKELRKERNEVNLATKEGQERAKQLNAQIDKNTAMIKANVSAIEQQKINIGNYKSALDGVHPALGKMAVGLDAGVNGLKGMSFAAKAFIATGIGAIIAAVGLALGALIKYFQGSEEGQNRLNKIMAVGSAIFEQFLNIVEAVGEAVFNAINDPQQALKDFGNLVKENIVNRLVGLLELIPKLGKAIGLLFEGKFVEAGQVAFDAMAKVTLGVEGATMKIVTMIDETGKAIDRGIYYGQKLSDLQAKIDKDERKLIEDRAKTNLQVAKLRQQAVELEGQAKVDAIKQAIALEEELSRREVEIAKSRLAYAELNIEANGDTKDALNEQAEAIAKVSQAEEQAFNNTLKFRKQLEGLNEEVAKAEEERASDTRAQARANSESAIKQEEEITNAFATQIQLRTDLAKKGNDDIAKINKKASEDAIEKKEKEAEIAELTEKRKYNAAMAVTDGILGLLDEQSAEYKAIATAQTLVST